MGQGAAVRGKAIRWLSGAARTGAAARPRALPVAALVVAALVPVACSDETDTPAAPPPSLSPAGEAGREVVRELGCQSCHSADGSESVGPTWKGLYGTEVRLDDGTTVVADDAYLTRAIQEPGAEIRDGFSAIMPERPLESAQLAAILDYLREIGDTR